MDPKASSSALDGMARSLWRRGIAGFCPTTLSAPRRELLETVSRLGRWIRSLDPSTSGCALPLGIHLEGPFISPAACGAHPPGALRRLTFEELDALWEASQHTLKILTLAPETLDASPGPLRKLGRWARQRRVVLSAGHSRATQEQARQAFDAGFTQVTHAWNALPFHQREPGVMGAALGRKDVYLELIPDQAHVSAAVLSWTRRIHGDDRLCLVSDCTPAAATRSGSWHRFGPLRVRLQQGACRLKAGHLAGGGLLLPQALSAWVQAESARGARADLLLRRLLPAVTRTPLKALGIPASRLRGRIVLWSVGPDGKVRTRPYPAPRRST